MITLINAVKKYWIACTVAMFAAITFLSLWPLEKLPSVPGTDKSHHLVAYAFLVLPAALRKPKHWKAYAVFFIAYSGFIELVQPFVNRYGEWLDMLANTSGVLCGIIIAALINYVASLSKGS
jgi:VanZ family protein